MSLSVPGVTVHPRTTWQDPTKPVTGLSARWDQITTNVAHYTADDDLIDGDPGEHASELPAYIRQMQANYLRSRGYSLGYCFAVDWLGGAWEIRGFDIRSAANAGDKRKTGVDNFNRYSFPVLFLVDGQDGLTPEAQHTARMLYREAERRAGRPLGRPRPHSDIDFTQCCGNGIRADIAAGLLDPTDPQPVTPPQPQPLPDQEDDMARPIAAIYQPTQALIDAGHTKTFALLADGSVRHATGPDVAYAHDENLTVFPINGTEHYRQCEDLDAVWRVT